MEAIGIILIVPILALAAFVDYAMWRSKTFKYTNEELNRILKRGGGNEK